MYNFKTTNQKLIRTISQIRAYVRSIIDIRFDEELIRIRRIYRLFRVVAINSR